MEMTIDKHFWQEFDRRLEEKLEQKLEEKLEQKLEQKFSEKFEQHLAPFRRETMHMFGEMFDQFHKLSERVSRVETGLEDLSSEMNERFDDVDNRFNMVFDRLSDHDDKFDIIIRHLARTDSAVADQNVRIIALEKAA